MGFATTGGRAHWALRGGTVEQRVRRMRREMGWLALGLTLLACLAAVGYLTWRGMPTVAAARARDATPGALAAVTPSALELVLAPETGDQPLDERIRELQRRIPASKLPAEELERLGWTFIARARERDDAGSYRLALAAAQAIEEREPNSRAGQLLRGHALQSRIASARPSALHGGWPMSAGCRTTSDCSATCWWIAASWRKPPRLTSA